MIVCKMGHVVLLLYLLATICRTTALIDGLYCGNENCYDVLGVERTVDAAAIRKAYRKLAVRYHPDKYKGNDALEKFQLITTAYEILKDEEERNNYDFMLDNPDLVYRHYYRYYRRRVAPQVDVRVVIAVTVVLISVMQYMAWWHSYNSAVTFALQMPKYRTKAREIAKEKGIWDELKRRKLTKEDFRAMEEEVLRTIVEKNLDITGGYSKPKIWDVLLFKILFSPYRLLQYIIWYVRWVWKFDIKGMEYGPEEKVYLTRRILELSQTQWEALPADKQNLMVGCKLWLQENLQQYKRRQEEEMKKLAGGKQKAYRHTRRYYYE